MHVPLEVAGLWYMCKYCSQNDVAPVHKCNRMLKMYLLSRIKIKKGVLARKFLPEGVGRVKFSLATPTYIAVA